MEKTQKHTISVLVENQAGVLSKVVGLFSRRGFNIDSLAVGETENPNLSRMTIVVTGTRYTVDQIEKQVSKLVPVKRVKALKPGEHISRALILFKLKSTPETRGEIMKTAEEWGAKAEDETSSTIILEFTGTSKQTRELQELLKPHILEVVRTGRIAVEKCAERLNS